MKLLVVAVGVVVLAAGCSQSPDVQACGSAAPRLLSEALQADEDGQAEAGGLFLGAAQEARQAGEAAEVGGDVARAFSSLADRLDEYRRSLALPDNRSAASALSLAISQVQAACD